VDVRIGALLGIVGSLAATVAAAAGEELTLRELPGNITEGTVVINAPPDEVYARATSFEQWPSVFSDVREAHWESGDREHARVRFKSKSFEHSVTVKFDNVPGHLIRFRSVKAPPGARARGEYTLTPIDGGRRTAVVARLYMNVVGPGRLLVSGHKIESMRRLKLTLDLGDTERWFAR
jgi:uncharacterized protein YndB with AHSA1/START domain